MVDHEILISSSYCRPSYEEYYKRQNGKIKAALDRVLNSIRLEERDIINKIILNGPATIFFWIDGTKTVVKCMETDKYDLYTAFCIALTKKFLGSNSKIKSVIKKAEIVDQCSPKKEECDVVSEEIAKIVKKVNDTLKLRW